MGHPATAAHWRNPSPLRQRIDRSVKKHETSRLEFAHVAQLDRVPGYEPGGRRFESFHARHTQRGPAIVGPFALVRGSMIRTSDIKGQFDKRRRRAERPQAGNPSMRAIHRGARQLSGPFVLCAAKSQPRELRLPGAVRSEPPRRRGDLARDGHTRTDRQGYASGISDGLLSPTGRFNDGGLTQAKQLPRSHPGAAHVRLSRLSRCFGRERSEVLCASCLCRHYQRVAVTVAVPEAPGVTRMEPHQ